MLSIIDKFVKVNNFMNTKNHTNNLFDEISSLSGVGEKLLSTLSKLNINTKIDLVLHLPISLTNVSYKNSLNEIIFNDVTTIQVTIKDYKTTFKTNFAKKPFQVVAEDIKNNILLINFFNYYSIAYLKKLFPLDSRVIIKGKFEHFGSKIITNHPEVITKINNTGHENTKERTYKTTYGLTSKRLANLIHTTLENSTSFTEWLSEDFIKNFKLPSFTEALKNIHLSNKFSLNTTDVNILRIALDEMLAFQLKLNLVKSSKKFNNGYIFKDLSGLVKKLYDNLPFTLTNSQITSIKEIFTDLKSSKQMIRLLEGDVGSGKTIVAFFSALLAVSCGYQVVLMAPTESLAKQHVESFNYYCSLLNIKLGLLTGSTKSKERISILKNIRNNNINILIGTHATFQGDISFNKLGLVIIDEQHRFGVMQRLQLINKDAHPHILMLSATPIPRTLALTNYGHIAISRLLDKPKNRKKVITKSVSNKRIQSILERVKQKVLENEKIFWICPLIEENEKLDYTAALVRYNSLLKYVQKDELWLLHGKMKSAEKDTILSSFRRSKKGILVSTTVVEVGIDIPDANIMVIEHADRFGLAQLHQLRGRVGRGGNEAFCLLIFSEEKSNTARKRMLIMEESSDGFYIAERDFELRGGGNVLGTKQSGESPFKIATIEIQNKYMKAIANYAKYLYLKDNKKYIEYSTLLNKIFHFNAKEFNFLDVFHNG